MHNVSYCYQHGKEKNRNQALAAKKLMHELNNIAYDDLPAQTEVIRKLFGSCGKTIHVGQRFTCDIGSNIHVGENFYANYNCTILDMGEVRIGDNCMIAPNVSIYAATHSLSPLERCLGYGMAIDVTIGDNVWIGGGSIILPGVIIGNNCVVGAGSVVCKDIPDNSLVVGNPARIIKTIPNDIPDIKNSTIE